MEHPDDIHTTERKNNLKRNKMGTKRMEGLETIKEMEMRAYELYQIYLEQIEDEEEQHAGKEEIAGMFQKHVLNETTNGKKSAERTETGSPSEKEGGSKEKVMSHFFLIIVVMTCLVSVWYSAAMLFPPQARDDHSLFLWDDGKLLFFDDGQPAICPWSSICSEGILQIVLFAISRVTAFACYVFMGVMFLSKMHFTLLQLPSSIAEQIRSFRSKGWKVFISLVVLHTISHYIRYIVRKDVDQLLTGIHITGLCSILVMIAAIFDDCFKSSIDRFEKGIKNSFNRLFIILCAILCFHHARTRIIILIFL